MPREYTAQKILRIFGSEVSRDALVKAEAAKTIPVAKRRQTGQVRTRIWNPTDLPKIGERYGFMKKPQDSACVAFFTTKGGVLKTTMAFNFARMAALHNIRTCVVGLDLQSDITFALGHNADIENAETLELAIEKINATTGLSDVFSHKLNLSDVIESTDLPTLSLIPETADLVSLDRAIAGRPNREHWLRKNIVEPLQKIHRFDLVVLDCSPNWNQLVSNALVACDVLVSPLECKINQYRNLQVFRALTEEFRQEMSLDYQQVFVPTRLTSTRKVSGEIRAWYARNIPNVTSGCVREAAHGEEAIIARLSIPEHLPSSYSAMEMREVLTEIWVQVLAKSRSQRNKKEFAA